MNTQADYWLSLNGLWRTCRKPFECHGLGGTRPENQCDHEIQKGERYLDTGETSTWPNTFRICTACADKPSRTIAKERGDDNV